MIGVMQHVTGAASRRLTRPIASTPDRSYVNPPNPTAEGCEKRSIGKFVPPEIRYCALTYMKQEPCQFAYARKFVHWNVCESIQMSTLTTSPGAALSGAPVSGRPSALPSVQI